MQFKKTLEIKADHKLMVIDVADILYIEASVNDCYIHMTSKRVYKDAFSVDKAIDILKESSGSHFEPKLVDEFIKIRSKIEKVFEENAD